MIDVAQEERTDRAITFAMARYTARVKADDYATDYSNVPFGAYAWYKGETSVDDADFMTNQKVVYDATDNVWKTDGTTYYWPRGGSLDFICYSPYSADSAPAIAENQIQWTGWSVSDNPGVDLMYATKAAGLTAPSTTYYYNGVPTLFHHALAQVAVKVRLAYHEAEPSTGDKTRWKVTIHGMTLKSLYTAGSLTLNLDAAGAWTVPETWTPSGETANLPLDISALPSELTDETLYDLGAPMFVLPQTLETTNLVDMEISITTERDSGSGYQPFLTESHLHVSAPLATTELPAWGINHRIVYTLTLAPSLPTEASGAQAPTEIHFDPAVEGWDTVSVSMNIDI